MANAVRPHAQRTVRGTAWPSAAGTGALASRGGRKHRPCAARTPSAAAQLARPCPAGLPPSIQPPPEPHHASRPPCTAANCRRSARTRHRAAASCEGANVDAAPLREREQLAGLEVAWHLRRGTCARSLPRGGTISHAQWLPSHSLATHTAHRGASTRGQRVCAQCQSNVALPAQFREPTCVHPGRAYWLRRHSLMYRS